MSLNDFNIFKGLVTNGFAFRGVDRGAGATFEHTCGYFVRIGPGAPISAIAEQVQKHRCEVEAPQAEVAERVTAVSEGVAAEIAEAERAGGVGGEAEVAAG